MSMNQFYVYRELKKEVRFEECYVKGAPSRLFLRFLSGIHMLFEEFGRHGNGVS